MKKMLTICAVLGFLMVVESVEAVGPCSASQLAAAAKKINKKCKRNGWDGGSVSSCTVSGTTVEAEGACFDNESTATAPVDNSGPDEFTGPVAGLTMAPVAGRPALIPTQRVLRKR